MKYTFKILAVVCGLALAMTAAYAHSKPPAARPAATSERTPPLVVPAALSPAFIPLCWVVGGLCETRAACAAMNGTVAQLPRPGCAGTENICCLLPDF